MIDLGFNQVEMMLLDPNISDYTKASDTHRLYQDLAQLHVPRIRIEAVWSYLETSRGVFNWTDLDRALILADQYGLRPLLILGVHRPSWGPDGTDFGNMCKAVANRYGPNGLGITLEYEIWNEQNHFQFWGSGLVSPAAYTAYLHAAAAGIRAVQPDAEIITGGLMPIGTLNIFGVWTLDPVPFLQGVYAAGGKDSFTAVGFHPYSIDYGFRDQEPTADQLFIAMHDTLLGVMDANGDTTKEIWWTEIGFPTPKLSEATKLDWLQKQLALYETRDRVGPVFIYNYRNSAADTSNDSNTYGLIDYAWNRKQPSWDYIASLSPNTAGATLFGYGTLSATVTRVASAGFAGQGSLTAGASIVQHVAAGFAGSGDLTVSVFGRPHADLSGQGTLSAVAFESYSATGDFAGAGSLSAVADIARRVTANFTGSGSVSCSSAQQRRYEYNFTGTGSTKPTTLFTDFAWYSQYGTGPSSAVSLPYTVAGGVANNGVAAGSNGTYYSGGIYKTDQLSPDHFSEIVTASYSNSGDRSDMAIVRADAAGDNFVAVMSRWGGSNSTVIFTCIAGDIQRRATSTDSLGTGDRLRLTADGNTYTATKNGAVMCTWVDNTNIYTGASNLRTGFGFDHVRSNLSYPAPGITGLWKGYDVRPSLSPQGLVFSGAGSLTAAVKRTAAATFTGSGSLEADAGDPQRPASLTGTGSLTAGISQLYALTASFSGAGGPSAQVVMASVNANLTGSGTLSVTVKRPAAFYSAGDGGVSSGTTALSTKTASWSHTITTSGPDTTVTLEASVSATSATPPAVSATYGGVSMTLEDSAAVTTTAAGRVYLFSLQNPPNNAQTASVTANLVGSIIRVRGTSIAYSNASGVSATAHNSGSTGTGMSVDIPTSVGDMAAAVFTRDATIISVSGTSRYSAGSSASGLADYTAVEDTPAAASTTTLSATGNSAAQWVGLGAAIQGATV